MDPTRTSLLRALPAVDTLLAQPAWQALALPTATARAAAREVIEAARGAVLSGAVNDPVALRTALQGAEDRALEALRGPLLRPLWNGTGVLVHTNTGRAPLSSEALAAIAQTAGTYANLELDLATGTRGSRQALLRPLLRWLGGAEDALVVNNGAAALMLALHALAPGRPVLVSRGELVEIGGSFRVPDVMRAAGVQLVEVGTTNRTHARDYAEAARALAEAGKPAAALLQIHRSNFDQVGFVATPSVPELAAIARESGAWLICDLGSGAVAPLRDHGLRDEPEIAATLAAGADLVTASGDKLLGGPQAGLLFGRSEAIARCGKAAMARALRPCGLTLAALEPTLRAHLRGRAETALPLWAAVTRPIEDLRALGERLLTILHTPSGAAADLSGALVPTEAAVGGGSQAGAALPSMALALRASGRDGAWLERTLRARSPAWLGRARADALLLDLRSLGCGRDDDAVVRAFGALCDDLREAMDRSDRSRVEGG